MANNCNRRIWASRASPCPRNRCPTVAPAQTTTSTQSSGADDVISLGDLEKNHILAILDKCSGNRTHAARKLGISIRTLRNKLNEYGLGGKKEGDEEAEDAAD